MDGKQAASVMTHHFVFVKYMRLIAVQLYAVWLWCQDRSLGIWCFGSSVFVGIDLEFEGFVEYFLGLQDIVVFSEIFAGLGELSFAFSIFFLTVFFLESFYCVCLIFLYFFWLFLRWDRVRLQSILWVQIEVQINWFWLVVHFWETCSALEEPFILYRLLLI